MAGRDIRAGAEKGGRRVVIRASAKRDFLLREGGFSLAPTDFSLWHKCFLGILGAKRRGVMSDN